MADLFHVAHRRSDDRFGGQQQAIFAAVAVGGFATRCPFDLDQIAGAAFRFGQCGRFRRRDQSRIAQSDPAVALFDHLLAFLAFKQARAVHRVHRPRDAAPVAVAEVAGAGNGHKRRTVFAVPVHRHFQFHAVFDDFHLDFRGAIRAFGVSLGSADGGDVRINQGAGCRQFDCRRVCGLRQRREGKREGHAQDGAVQACHVRLRCRGIVRKDDGQGLRVTLRCRSRPARLRVRNRDRRAARRPWVRWACPG